jgi:iron complex outermembrane recepter protein
MIRSGWSFLAVATIAMQTSVALAQSDTSVETVVVTAEKRVENVQDVPISIQVVSGKTINDFQRSDIRDLSATIPDLNIQQTPGDYQIYIRGIGSGNQNFAFDQDVSIYDDGVYGGRAHQFADPFFDVERVEVLRGPQGALLGKNTSAGAINVVSAQPTDSFESEINVGTDFFTDVPRLGLDTWGYISGPLTDTLQGRLAVKYLDQTGYIENRTEDRDEPQQKNFQVRGTLRYEPTSNLTVTGKLEFANLDEAGTNAEAIIPGVQNSLTNYKYAVDPFGVEPRDKTNSLNGTLTADYNLGGFTLTSISGASAYTFSDIKDGGVSNPDGYLYLEHEHFQQYSQELRLVSPTGGTLEYIFGAYADYSHLETPLGFVYDLFGGTFAGNETENFVQNSSTQSVFGQATWNIASNWSLSGSLRYTHIFKSADYSNVLVSGAPLAGPPVWVPPNYLRGSRDESHLDPSATLKYQVTPDTMLYASYTRGSKAGGFVADELGVEQSDFEFKPETSTGYEAGIKSSVLDDQLVLDLTVFDTVFRNLQVSTYLPAVASSVVANADSATTKGVEFNGDWYPGGGFSAHAALAYLDAKYDNYLGAVCLYNNPTCNLTTNNIGGTQIPFTSKWSGSVSLDYTTQLDNGWKLSLSEVTNFRSDYTIDADLDPASTQKSFAKVDARIVLSSSDDKYSLALLAKNLFDKRTFNFDYVWPFTPGDRVKFLDETRMIGLTATVRFQ